MRRSKFEMYTDIMRIMAYQGPKKITHLMYKSNTNMLVLKKSVRQLINKGLIQETKTVDNRKFYNLTKQGLAAVKAFDQLSEVMPNGGNKVIAQQLPS